MDLIKIIENQKGEKLVSARELYRNLGMDSKNISRWLDKNIVGDIFFTENIDYVSNVFKTTGNNKTVNDYILKLDMAKHLCMMARTSKAKEIRDYFVECEKELRGTPKVPQSFREALLLAAEQQEVIEQQEQKIIEMKPKEEFYNEIIESKNTIDIGTVAKVINRGIGRNKLFKLLREKRILQGNNTPYQEYIDRGYFRCIETKFTKPNGSININVKTVVFQKGVDYISKIIVKGCE